MANPAPLAATEKLTAEKAEELNASGIAYAIGSHGQQDHQTAVDYFLKAAQAKHPNALYNLHLAYEYGLGVPKNHALAMEYQLKAAEHGCLWANFVFRKWFEPGTSTQEIIESRLQDSENNPENSFQLGLLYESGLVDGSINYPRAYQCYQRAVELGFREAPARLGYLFENGLGVEQDFNKAFKHYWHAAYGYRACFRDQFNLGRCYRQGLGCSVDLESAENWLWKAMMQHFLPAVYEYITLAASGFLPAQISLGRYYWFGQWDYQDYREGSYWIQLSAQSGENYGQRLAGMAFRDGLGVTQDDEQALWWFSQAALQRNEHAKASIGFCYLNGKGLKKDYQAAFDWFSKAAEQGSAWGSYGLGLLYEKGLGVTQSYSKAVECYQQAYPAKIPQAKIRLGFCYAVGLGTQPNHFKALLCYENAAKEGARNVAYNVGVLSHTGVNLPIYHTTGGKALAAYQLAAEAGDVAAHNNLGVLFEEEKEIGWHEKPPRFWEYGKSVMTFNDDLEEWYQEKNHRSGEYLLNLNPRKAVSWYHQAAKQQHAAALFNLARCYQLGLGVPQDHQTAISYYHKAAKQQVAAAYNNLGVFYAIGLETPKNSISALRYFAQAAKLRCTEAFANLDSLRDSGSDEAFVYCLQPMINPIRGYKKMPLKNQKVIWLQEYLASESLEQDQI